MGRYTKQDVIDLVRENDVEFIRLQFSDLFGTMKNVAITARQLEKALDNKCTFDGSSVDDLSVLKNQICIYIQILTALQSSRGMREETAWQD